MSNVTQLSQPSFKRKQLEVTAEMLEQISFVADADVSETDIVVFEATAASTRPITKPGSVFHEAQISRATLQAMAEAVNTKGQSVPLHTLHLQGNELPVGRVFAGRLEDTATGQTDLKAQFYLAKSEVDMIEKINLGILDEVSVGMTSEKMSCSKCGWDYRGEDATFMHFLDQTCENGHTIGESGTHVIMQGLDRWMELSLVSRGASRGAKIHGRAKSLMPKEQQDRIAASGNVPEAVALFATPTTEKETTMATKPEVTPTPTPAAPAEFDAKAAFEGLDAKLSQLIETLTPADDSVPTPAPVAAETTAEFTELKDAVTALTASVTELATKKAASNLASDLPTGGLAAAADTGSGKEAALGQNFSGFTTRK